MVKRTIRRIAFVGLVVASSFALLPSLGLAAEPEGSLVLEATIPLAGVGGRIDHMAVDLKRNRLIVAELGNNTVEVIDLAGHKVVHRITGLHEPQGVGYAEPSDLILVANAGDGAVQMFHAQDLSPAGSVSLGDDADNIRINPRDGTVVVGYGSGGLAIIDPASRTKIADIKLADHPEGFQIDPNTQHAFVNVPGAHEIAVIGLEDRRQRASWRVPGATANFPLALDPAGNLLATVFRTPPKLVLIDRRTGGISAELAACGDADDVFFDGRRQRIYVSCGSGEVAIFERQRESWRPLIPAKTEGGARTSLFVPELDRLFVARRAGLLGREAAILVYRPIP
jgi:DNA-binding beta-propeller fold protein YncE